MIGDALRVEIEQYAATMPRENAMYRAAAEGAFTPAMATYYVANLRHLIRQTPRHLRAAFATAGIRGRPELARYFHAKIAEEVGHDVWGTHDLCQLQRRFGTTEASATADRGISPVLIEQISFIDGLVSHDPRHYLVYIYFVEYLVSLLGDAWLDLVEARCGIPRSALSILGRHVELDGDHAAEGKIAIDALIDDPAMLSGLRATLHRSLAYFHTFCEDVVAHDLRAARVA